MTTKVFIIDLQIKKSLKISIELKSLVDIIGVVSQPRPRIVDPQQDSDDRGCVHQVGGPS